MLLYVIYLLFLLNFLNSAVFTYLFTVLILLSVFFMFSWIERTYS